MDGEWVCTNCGNAGAHPLDQFMLIDQRYATGYCDQCNDPHPKTPRKTPRPVHQLVRDVFFRREKWEEDKARAKLAGYISAFGTGTSSVSMSDRNLMEFVELYDRFQPAGFHMPASIREEADKMQAKPAKKRR